MKSFYSVLLLLIPIICVLSQETLDQPGSVIVKPSEPLNILCKVSYSVSSYYTAWVRQLPGKGLEYMGRITSGGSQQIAPSFQGKITISRDTSKNEVSFRMPNMKSAESGVYYCAREGLEFDYWGGGTSVLVTSVPISAPSVFPLIPCCNNVDLTTEVTMGCLATGYMPEPVEIQWNGGSIKTGIKTTNAVLSTTNSLFIQSSQLSIPASEWKNSTYQCNVKHASTGTNQEKTLRVLPCIQPAVQVFLESPCASASAVLEVEDIKEVNATLDLVCLISDYYPGEINVRWLVNGKEDVSAEAYPPSSLKTKEGKFSANSRLTILKGQWNRDMKYSCIVTHPSSNTITTANISKCAEPCLDNIEVYLTPPSFEDLYITRIAKIYCLVSGMRTIENFEVSWTREKGGKLDVVNENPILHDNGTFSALSVLTVCAEEWENQEKFTCTVKNQDLPSPIKKSIFKQNEGVPKAPALYLLPPSQEELSLQEMISITALVKGFRPNNIFIKWQQGGDEISQDKYVNISPMKKEGEETYFTISVLNVPAADWNKGSVYTCIVGHEALPFYLKQQSIDKTAGKATNINVCLAMSETGSTCS